MEGVSQTAVTLIFLGGIYWIGLLTDALVRHTRLALVMVGFS